MNDSWLGVQPTPDQPDRDTGEPVVMALDSACEALDADAARVYRLSASLVVDDFDADMNAAVFVLPRVCAATRKTRPPAVPRPHLQVPRCRSRPRRRPSPCGLSQGRGGAGVCSIGTCLGHGCRTTAPPATADWLATTSILPLSFRSPVTWKPRPGSISSTRT